MVTVKRELQIYYVRVTYTFILVSSDVSKVFFRSDINKAKFYLEKLSRAYI